MRARSERMCLVRIYKDKAREIAQSSIESYLMSVLVFIILFSCILNIVKQKCDININSRSILARDCAYKEIKISHLCGQLLNYLCFIVLSFLMHITYLFLQSGYPFYLFLFLLFPSLFSLFQFLLQIFFIPLCLFAHFLYFIL